MKGIRFRITRIACCIVFSICVMILTFFLFLQPAHVNHYLPKNALSEIKINGSETFDTLEKKPLQRVHPQRVVHAPIKHVYPRRKHMEPCKPLFGQIGIFVAVNSDHDKRLYKIAQASLKCYMRSTNYKFFYINIDTDERSKGQCNQTNVYYKRHCVASYYIQDVDWMLFLDGDIGVVNPNHCVEEWIDDRVDMIFYERFFNWEIMAGSFLFKNTEQSRKFLIDFANMEYQQFNGFTGYDNGVLQILILKAALPGAIAEIKACDEIYHRSKTLDEYYNYVTCVKLQLGATRVWPGILRIYRRGHGWARDSQLAGNHWSDNDFMFHAWKASKLNSTWFDANVFEKIPDPKECGKGLDGWHWTPEKHVSIDYVKKHISNFEIGVAAGYSKKGRDLPHLIEPDVRDCYPDCDKFT